MEVLLKRAEEVSCANYVLNIYEYTNMIEEFLLRCYYSQLISGFVGQRRSCRHSFPMTPPLAEIQL